MTYVLAVYTCFVAVAYAFPPTRRALYTLVALCDHLQRDVEARWRRRRDFPRATLPEKGPSR